MLSNQRWAHPLPSLDALPPDAAAADARVSVIVPARDEADAIEASVRHLLAQRGVALEVIVVSDRSVDETAAIVRRLAATDPRVRVIEVSTLPEGWLGKTHALHVGSQAATGDWLLFTDADCLLHPDVVARALRVAARERVEHIALTPAPIAADDRRLRLALRLPGRAGRLVRPRQPRHAWRLRRLRCVQPGADIDASRLRRSRAAATHRPRRRPARPARSPGRRPLSRLPRRRGRALSLGHDAGRGGPADREELFRRGQVPRRPRLPAGRVRSAAVDRHRGGARLGHGARARRRPVGRAAGAAGDRLLAGGCAGRSPARCWRRSSTRSPSTRSCARR